ncbi:SRPBCC family protein [Shimazuella kribbensis]|uniref:SRPBCC family protein n=1 Tax=Shimazuella kribbensis TaxID=139808 RepID=UPI0003FA506B|nr:SRPBCC family protein [Shimazuella kribbensis]
MIAKTLSITIGHPPEKVYEFIMDPINFTKWTTSFTHSIQKIKDEWIVETTDGQLKLRFIEKNTFGVADHYVTTEAGIEISNHIRVIPNDSGSELTFTLFQIDGMSDAQFSNDYHNVESDLKILKSVLEKK